MAIKMTKRAREYNICQIIQADYKQNYIMTVSKQPYII